MIRSLTMCGCLLAASLPTIVHAKSWPSAGGWDVIQGDDHCAIHLEYEGPGDTELNVMLQLDGTVLLAMYNSNWTIKEDEKVELEYRLNGGSYGGGKAVGLASSGKRGFVTSFDQNFLNDFVQS